MTWIALITCLAIVPTDHGPFCIGPRVEVAFEVPGPAMMFRPDGRIAILARWDAAEVEV